MLSQLDWLGNLNNYLKRFVSVHIGLILETNLCHLQFDYIILRVNVLLLMFGIHLIGVLRTTSSSVGCTEASNQTTGIKTDLGCTESPSVGWVMLTITQMETKQIGSSHRWLV